MRFSNEALLDDYKLGIINLQEARGTTMTDKEILDSEVQHRQDNYKAFGYDRKPSKALVKGHVLEQWDEVKRMYEEGE